MSSWHHLLHPTWYLCARTREQQISWRREKILSTWNCPLPLQWCVCSWPRKRKEEVDLPPRHSVSPHWRHLCSRPCHVWCKFIISKTNMVAFPLNSRVQTCWLPKLSYSFYQVGDDFKSINHHLTQKWLFLQFLFASNVVKFYYNEPLPVCRLLKIFTLWCL